MGGGVFQRGAYFWALGVSKLRVVFELRRRLAAQSDVDKALDEWGVGPNAEKMDEEAAAKKDAGPQLPDLKDLKLPGDLKLPDVDLKLPKLPDNIKLPWD